MTQEEYINLQTKVKEYLLTKGFKTSKDDSEMFGNGFIVTLFAPINDVDYDVIHRTSQKNCGFIAFDQLKKELND